MRGVFVCKNSRVDSKIFIKIHSAKNNKKNSKVWGHTLSEFRSHCKAAVYYWRKDGHIDQWNRIEKLEINTHIYGQLIFEKGEIGSQWKNSIFNIWW